MKSDRNFKKNSIQKDWILQQIRVTIAIKEGEPFRSKRDTIIMIRKETGG